MRIKNILFSISFLFSPAFFLQAQLRTVKTDNGSVSGIYKEGVSIYKGIPFAAPPVGKLRWKAPQPAAKWKGILECKQFSASPYQPKPEPFYCWSKEFIAPPEPLNEDCLYLNVWTPATNNKEKHPVLVWIYGGGFSSGSAACAIYDGEEMAKRGIVFVSINYRVGAFGFMAHPELSKEQNNVSGNYGILDQIAALQWVKKNIAAFGGDPLKVTIAGQSAGSLSVNALLASPLAKNLFHGAILQSAGLLGSRFPTTLKSAEDIGLELQKKTGAVSIDDLRNLPAGDILKASQSLGSIRLGLTLDGYVLPTDLLSYFKQGKHNNVPLLMGWVTGDENLFGKSDITAEAFIKQAKEAYSSNTREFLEIFPANNNDEAQRSQGRLVLLNFASFPAYLLAKYNNKPTFLYQSSYIPTDKPNFQNYGAFHTSDVPYTLHNLHLWDRPWQQRDFDMQELMSSYWIQFIKTGNPNGNGFPDWKRYITTTGCILSIDTVTILKPGLFKPEFEMLEKNL